MKNVFRRTAACLLLSVFGMMLTAGCHSSQTTDKTGGEMNSAMSEQQKAIIAEHKKQGEQ